MANKKKLNPKIVADIIEKKRKKSFLRSESSCKK